MFHSRKIQFILITFLVHGGFMVFPRLFLNLYQFILFPLFRIVYDNTFGLSPIPILYFTVIGLVIYFYLKMKNFFKYRHELLYSFYYKNTIKKLLVFFLFVYSLFYWVWGFHYYQKSIFSWDDQNTVLVDTGYLKNEINSVVIELNILRGKIEFEDIQELKVSGFVEVENIIREHQKNIFSKLGKNGTGNVRVRVVKPEGSLLRWSTTGIYIPFVFEGHIDAGLHPLQYIFTAAHEMAHGYGLTNEGDCNVVALLTCLQSDQSIVRYSGLLTYFRYLWYDPRVENIGKELILEKLSPIIKKDLVEIREQSKKFPDFFPVFRDYVYDFYLKWMGMEEGLLSYHSIVDKVAVLKKLNPELVIIQYVN